MRTKIRPVENTPRVGVDVGLAMEEKRPAVRRPNVLKKLNNESLTLIERGLLGDLPDKLKPNYIPHHGQVRGRSDDLTLVTKPTSFLSSCLPVIPDTPSPVDEKFASSEDEGHSPFKKSFSFRDRFSRISFLKKTKSPDKTKWKSIVEEEKGNPSENKEDKSEHDYKSSKRFWLFRNKDLMDNKKGLSPIYQRSKSFEFLPRASIEEESEQPAKPHKRPVKNSQSFVLGRSDSIGEAWASNDSLEYVSNVYYDNDDSVFLKSIRELSPDSSKQSSLSTGTSNSSGLVMNIFNTESVQNLLDEFEKTVDLFSESYLSDCEPYTRSSKDSVKEKRKSASFSTLPSPKVMQVPKVSEISEDFKTELTKLLSEKRASALPGYPGVRSARRGSVTDWFVLEDHAAAMAAEENKYRRAQKKPMNRVRRMSSTKYVSIFFIKKTFRKLF